MAVKSFFKGKSGCLFWGNCLFMLVILIGVPVGTFFLLNPFTHHGEKIEVPKVVGMSTADARSMLESHDLKCVVNDSVYDAKAKPGQVLDQSPKPGTEVKSDRCIFLTVNLMGKPMGQITKVDGSLREVETELITMGFIVKKQLEYGRDKDLVIRVQQGGKTLNVGDMVSKVDDVIIVVGAGELPDVDELESDSTQVGVTVNDSTKQKTDDEIIDLF